MINFHAYNQIHHLNKHESLNVSQIANELQLDEKTVSKWLQCENYQAREGRKASSKLDPYKAEIKRLLEKHAYSAQQILTRIQSQGYPGRYTILREYVNKVRPSYKSAYLKLSFGPGECAQVDWGSYKSIALGNTRRRLSFFVMVLSYSRMMYVEFTLSEKMEHFLQCHQNAFKYFGGVPEKVMIDNLKAGVLSHRPGQNVQFNPRYLDFARHCGFEPIACNVRRANEKGRVERGVGYVKNNLLRGLDAPDYKVLCQQSGHWLENTANVRVHRETQEKPVALFKAEKKGLSELPLHDYDVGRLESLRASSTFRITLDTNRYSVPAEYASQQLDVRIYPEKLLIYSQGKLIAEHIRSYGRNGDFENPDHVKELLSQRRKAKHQKLLQRFIALSNQSEKFYLEMKNRRLNPMHHLKKIIALCDIYSFQKVAEAIEDACELGAYSSEYIANILEQRIHPTSKPGPLHLTHKSDLLDMETPLNDLSIYDENTNNQNA